MENRQENNEQQGTNPGNAAGSAKKPSAEIEQTENRKKVVVNELTQSVITKLPDELTAMLEAARKANNPAKETPAPAKAEPPPQKPVAAAEAPKAAVPDTPKKPSAEIEQTENRKKVVVNELTNSVITKLPDELSAMLKAARQENNAPKEASIEPAFSANPEKKNDTPKINVQVFAQNTPIVPPPPPLKAKTNNNEKIINEEGSIFGLQVNVTNRKEVLERMKGVSKINITNPGESIFKYDDLGIVFYFGEGGNLQEITFSYPFDGSTSKGLKLEESVNKAIQIYGQPKMKTNAGAIWNKFAVFLKDDIVTTIRLRSS